MYRKHVPNVAFTHGGVFHADDVFSAALLRILNPEIKIERGFAVPAHFDGIVFDIGGGEFDHHQVNRRTRSNGVPYASFGLLWERFGALLLQSDDASSFEEAFVQPIDYADNTDKRCMVSLIVSDFNPRSGNPSDYDKAFLDALAWAEGVLKRRFRSISEARIDYNYVVERMEQCDGKVLILERGVSWQPAVIGSSYLFAVYPSVRGGFNAQAVPASTTCSGLAQSFPSTWRGKSDCDLQKATGVVDAVFCHPAGFLCAARSCNGACALAYKALDQERR